MQGETVLRHRRVTADLLSKRPRYRRSNKQARCSGRPLAVEKKLPDGDWAAGEPLQGEVTAKDVYSEKHNKTVPPTLPFFSLEPGAVHETMLPYTLL